MRGITTLLGLLATLALLAFGLLLLPGPGINSIAGLFSALWLFISLAAALAFGREALRREQLIRIRKGLRRTAGRGFQKQVRGEISPDSREVFIRQRGRRTD